MKKLCAVLASVTVFALSLPFLPVSAADVPDSAIAFESLMSNYGLSGTDISGKTVTFCYGVNASTGATQAAIWIDNAGYKRVVASDGSVRFDGVYSYWFQFADAWCGHPYMAQFWYSTSDDYQLVSFSSSDSGRVTEIYNNVSSVNTNYRDYTFITGSGTSLGGYYDDYTVQVSPAPETTTATSSGGFQLPDDWISGGETLPAGEVETFEGVNESQALEDFSSILDDSSQLTTDSSFLGSVGLFWAIVQRMIDTLGVWVFVFAVMTLGIIAWVLGR